MPTVGVCHILDRDGYSMQRSSLLRRDQIEFSGLGEDELPIEECPCMNDGVALVDSREKGFRIFLNGHGALLQQRPDLGCGETGEIVHFGTRSS